MSSLEMKKKQNICRRDGGNGILGMPPRLTDRTDLTDGTGKTRKRGQIIKKGRREKTSIRCLPHHDTGFRDIVRLVRPVRIVRQSRKAGIPQKLFADGFFQCFMQFFLEIGNI